METNEEICAEYCRAGAFRPGSGQVKSGLPGEECQRTARARVVHGREEEGGGGRKREGRASGRV